MPITDKTPRKDFQAVIINDKGYKVVQPLMMPTMRS